MSEDVDDELDPAPEDDLEEDDDEPLQQNMDGPEEEAGIKMGERADEFSCACVNIQFIHSYDDCRYKTRGCIGQYTTDKVVSF